MTTSLQKAFDEAAALPDVDQDFIGWFVLDEIEKSRLRDAEPNGDPQEALEQTTGRTLAGSVSGNTPPDLGRL
jgi:hypothetical protein